MYYSTNYNSPIGAVMIASDGENIIGLWLEGQAYYGGSVADELSEKDDLPIFAAAKDWLDRYFDGKKPNISELPLAPIGGAFRQAVWSLLCEIPYGECITYGDIAIKLGKSAAAARAVGGAVGHNPISIIIPCHRVVGADGNLTGYAGGIDKKVKLLKHEGVDCLRLQRR